MLMGEACNREVIIVGRTTSVIEAAQLMRRHHVGDVVVVEERDGQRVPVGILTDRDIVVSVIAEHVSLEQLTVGDVMSFDLLTAEEESTVWDNLQQMRAKGVRRVPVVDARGALVGILSTDDVLDLLAEELRAVARLVQSEQVKERKLRTLP
jgi:CBS domain-containing protein